MDDSTKRKTKTSTEVKSRWIKKNLLAVGCKLDKDLVLRFRQALDANGDVQAQIIKKAIIDYLESKDANK